jgi:restriction endonuclease
MPILEFKEIPSAAGGAARDQFELFARELLELAGFKIVTSPDRGADAGRDLIVEEIRTGVAGETRVRWLVSCKHKAHSGNSVTPDDEQDIHDRVRTHGCSGFLVFYSTVPSSGLATKLNAPDLPFEVQIFDQEKIERYLLRSSGIELAKRFFPASFARWSKEHPKAAKIFGEEPHLSCCYCNKNLLLPKPHGIVVVWSSLSTVEKPRTTEHVYWCCNGQCDRVLKEKYWRRGIVDGWEDIPDLLAPIAYIRWVIVLINQLQRGDKFAEEAIESMRDFLLNLFPFVAREMTESERERISQLSIIPSYLGGWGYE